MIMAIRRLRRLLAPADAIVLGVGVGLLVVAGVAADAAADEQGAAPGTVALELNKTEAQPAGCRVYFVLDNGTADSFDAFKLDLVVFASDGVILRNLATEMGPLRADKRVVKMFDLGDLACDGIGSLLVNDVLACSAAGQERADCIDLLTVGSRADVALMK
jgi:hypothetical protein